MPGIMGLKLFLRRHPRISMKNGKELSKNRATVIEKNIREWCTGLKNNLISINASDILDYPARIDNMHETSVQLCSKTGKLL